MEDEDPAHHDRHLVVALIETGLRGGEACTLPFNPVLADSSGWPCLRFEVNVRSGQLIPLSARAAAAISAQPHPDRAYTPPRARPLTMKGSNSDQLGI